MGADFQARMLGLPDPQPLAEVPRTRPTADLRIHLRGGGTPIYVAGLPADVAQEISDRLTKHSRWSRNGFYTLDHNGTVHNIRLRDVAGVEVITRARARTHNVIEREDGGFVADGTDPQIPLGTPVNAEGLPLDNPYGDFS